LCPANNAEDADLIIANTCSVTAEADRMARAFLRRAHRRNPNAKIIVTGCYAQRDPQGLANLDGVSAVVGNSHKALISKIASEAPGFVPISGIVNGSGSSAPVFADNSFAHAELAMAELGITGQTRPNLKVQDGCSNRCSFCIIPTTRGASRSRSLAVIVAQINEFVAGGGYELVLSGINLGRWGRDLTPSSRLEQLVAAILEQTALPRLRLSSIEPMDWSQELLALFAQYGADSLSGGPRLARHAHLPLQSGSDAILRGMHRRYRPWHYADKVESIARLLPGAAIGADVMVGFPGESEQFFRESYEFIEKLPFTYLHLFPFSARPGTKAWALHESDPVPVQAVQERMAALRALIAEKNRVFREQFAGQVLPALTLQTPEETALRGKTEALTDNFLKLEVEGSFPSNRPLAVRIQNLIPDGLSGQVVEHLPMHEI
jgi:threonylcarbamoyladenosine tRNA methylthiotransferase MtaB